MFARRGAEAGGFRKDGNAAKLVHDIIADQYFRCKRFAEKVKNSEKNRCFQFHLRLIFQESLNGGWRDAVANPPKNSGLVGSH